MPLIALLNKEILASRELYLNEDIGTNLALFLLGKIVSLPRNGRLCYEIEWDQASRLSIPEEFQHHVRSSIPNSDQNKGLVTNARMSFMWALSEQMLQYKHDVVPVLVPTARAEVCRMVASGIHVPLQSKQRRYRCCVCQLEVSLSNEISERGVKSSSVAKCGCDDCCIAAHTSILRDDNRKIHSFPGFENMTCFEIAHQPIMTGLWIPTRIGYTTRPKHNIMRQLKRIHGHTPTVRRPRSRLENQTEDIAGEVLFTDTEVLFTDTGIDI